MLGIIDLLDKSLQRLHERSCRLVDVTGNELLYIAAKRESRIIALRTFSCKNSLGLRLNYRSYRRN